ncbi:DUF523 domain-containing protein [Candidatus Magnetaquicoccus inordinatus]|uniref:DUF523 domain-containing protein n=1 Tax=Candidatus Magnetaquicoccus inordinatus TaxID=2496818 RepID=UPI00102BE3F4|nr:DUF523 domain-containing protein [Candidatus Magnetaquicoccus inordinatus]
MSISLPTTHPFAPGRIRVAISACLLGIPVRYDGGHKENPLLTNSPLTAHMQWIPFCPEQECGLGTPREPMQWQGDPLQPRLRALHSQRDYTQQLQQWCTRQVRLQRHAGIAGWLLKSRSPSCGVTGVEIQQAPGQPPHRSIGLFPRLLLASKPQAVITEGDLLQDEPALVHFLSRLAPATYYACSHSAD